MGINSLGSNNAALMAQLQNNIAAQGAAEQGSQVDTKEGTEGLEAGAEGVSEEGSTTATENAVHGSNEQGESGGQGGQSQSNGQEQGQGQGEQGESVQAQKGAGQTSGTTQAKGIVNAEALKEVAATLLDKAGATSTDIEGVKTAPTQASAPQGPIDFSRPNIEAPAKTLSTAELMMEMIRLGTESFERGVKTQSEGIKLKTETKLNQIEEKAKDMQEYYNKVRQSNKSPFIAFFEGLAKLFTGDLEGAKASFETAWENGKNLLITIVVGIAALALTALTGGGAAALMIGVLALVIGTVFTDPGLMKELVKACGVDTNSEFGKNLVNALCIVATVISVVLSLGANPSGLVKGLTKGLAKVMKQLGSSVAKQSAKAAKEAIKGAKSTITSAIAKAQSKIAEKGAQLSAKSQNISKAADVAIQAGGGAAQTGLNVEQGIKTSEGMAARASAMQTQVNLDAMAVDEEKSNQLTSMLMEQYQQMMETLIAAVTSLNASTVNAARA